MNRVREFFQLEQSKAGWRFWILWVVMTNVGFFSGLAISSLLGNLFGYRLLQATTSAIIIGFFTGLAQSVVLRRHQISGLGWTIATTLGWTVGIFIAGLIIFNLFAYVVGTDFFYWILPSAFIAGAIVGIPQTFVLRQRWPDKSWQWIVISTIGWGIQFPGMLPGFFLTRWLRPSDEKQQ